MASSYWKIHYGPGTTDNETDEVAQTIFNVLNGLKGLVQQLAMYIQKSEGTNDWKDVVALVKVDKGITLFHLRMRLTSSFTKHETLFRKNCRYEPLDQAQFEQLLHEYESNRL